MNMENHLILWNLVSLKILDVQRAELTIGDNLHSSQLTSSTLLYAINGRARLLLDGAGHQLESGYVCHAAKAQLLQFVISPTI